jgi:hypothetical protein
MTGKENSHHFITRLLIRQSFAAIGITHLEHHAKQVISWIFARICDQRIDRIVQSFQSAVVFHMAWERHRQR